MEADLMWWWWCWEKLELPPMLVPELVPLASEEPAVVVCPLCRLGLEW